MNPAALTMLSRETSSKAKVCYLRISHPYDIDMTPAFVHFHMAARFLTLLTTGIGHDDDSDRSSLDGRRLSLTPPSSPPGSPPHNFAPRGPVRVRRTKFRDSIPSPLKLDLRLDLPNIAKNIHLDELHNAYEVSHATAPVHWFRVYAKFVFLHRQR